ncbi:GNAT family N-acetyltransferase [Streptomyces sp. NPDC101165]|uniref:GNAT family N-acetyltransferase n=1 Tax=Streptomyces sp. NPDC101165 TaxID=3366119 RepID=UPI003814D5F5
MTKEFPADLTIRPARAEDYTQVLSALDAWRVGPHDAREEAPLSRFLFEDFLATGFAAENTDGGLAGFLVGSLSQSDRRAAHVHQVAVDPRVRRRGVATVLYERFFAAVRAHGRHLVRCHAAAGAAAMLHERLGFVPSPETTAVVLDLDTCPQSGSGRADATPSAVGALRLRILEPVFALEHRADRREPGDGTWHAMVQAPEGLTVIREAGPATPEAERWIGLYDADAGHGLDVPGLLAAVVSPLAGAAVPVFVASTYHADMVLVPRSFQHEACAALRDAGHEVRGLAPRPLSR